MILGKWDDDGGRLSVVRHAIPDGDRRRHAVSAFCWCYPHVRFDGGMYVCCHHSLDGREVRERFGVVGRPWLRVDRMESMLENSRLADAWAEAQALAVERNAGG